MQLKALIHRKQWRRHMRCGAFFAVGKRFRTPTRPQPRDWFLKMQKFEALGHFLCILMKIFILHSFYFTHLQADMCWCKPHTTENVYKLFPKTPNLHFSRFRDPRRPRHRALFRGRELFRGTRDQHLLFRNHNFFSFSNKTNLSAPSFSISSGLFFRKLIPHRNHPRFFLCHRSKNRFGVLPFRTKFINKH